MFGNGCDASDIIGVINDEGRPFHVRIVREGGRYGLDNCLTFPSGAFERKQCDAGDTLVEWYDATYANDPRFGPLGQFVSRYFASTLRSAAARGICLDGGVAAWVASASNVRAALRLSGVPAVLPDEE